MMVENVVVVAIWSHITNFWLDHTNQWLHRTDKTKQKMRHFSCDYLEIQWQNSLSPSLSAHGKSIWLCGFWAHSHFSIDTNIHTQCYISKRFFVVVVSGLFFGLKCYHSDCQCDNLYKTPIFSGRINSLSRRRTKKLNLVHWNIQPYGLKRTLHNLQITVAVRLVHYETTLWKNFIMHFNHTVFFFI